MSDKSPGLPTVVIVGGVNHDTIVRVPRLPQVGETVIGRGLQFALGGKAANQAVAVARSGASVALLAAVGQDAAGDLCLDRLVTAGVDVSAVKRIEGTPTGQASIWVDDAGQNSIVVTPAANGLLSTADVEVFDDVIGAADVLVVQGEIWPNVSAGAIVAAQRHGTRVIVNLAPYADFAESLEVADPLVVNEVEAAQLLGTQDRLDGGAAALRLSGYARSVVITLGSEGAVVVCDGVLHRIPTPPVDSVLDTTGAGDAFVGVLAAALAAGLTLADATTRAVHAATASTQVHGAGNNYPSFDIGISSEVTA